MLRTDPRPKFQDHELRRDELHLERRILLVNHEKRREERRHRLLRILCLCVMTSAMHCIWWARRGSSPWGPVSSGVISDADSASSARARACWARCSGLGTPTELHPNIVDALERMRRALHFLLPLGSVWHVRSPILVGSP